MIWVNTMRPFKASKKQLCFKPDNAEAWYSKGVAFIQQSKLDEAIKAFDEAIRLNPKDTEAWNNKGNALSQQGKYNESIEAFE
jgi:tetratricopeptide (TPR) repeat protein